ncbi:MAG: ABC transporter permease [Sphaerochaeta sp.]
MKNNNIGKDIANSLIPVILAFIIGGFIIAFLGENPFTTYWVLIKKSLLTTKGFANTLHYAAPMILTGLAIAVTFKANIFNMGVEGSFVLGGFCTAVFASRITGLDPITTKLLCFVIGAVFGMLFSLIPALLKANFKVDEMVVTLMLNYALVKILEFLATGPFREQGAGYVCTATVSRNSMFTRFGNTRLTFFFFITLVVFILMYILMKKSKLGYEITAIGQNSSFSEACGMRVKKKIIILMLLSGALAGFAGAGYMLSDQYKYTLSFSGNPGMGWDGMLISLLGSHSPVGVFIAAIFYSVLKTGSDNINLYTAVPQEIVAVIQSLIILLLSIQYLNKKTHILENLFSRIRNKGGIK